MMGRGKWILIYDNVDFLGGREWYLFSLPVDLDGR